MGDGYRSGVNDKVSVGQALLISTIPAVVALLGVIGTVWLGFWQTRKTLQQGSDDRAAARAHEVQQAAAARAHERQLERERALLADRLTLYRLLVETADLLLASGAHLPTGPGHVRNEAIGRWDGLRVGARLLASPDVAAAVEAIDAERKRHSNVATSWLLKRLEAGASSDPMTAGDTDEEWHSWWRDRLFDIEQNATLMEHLIDSCREHLTETAASGQAVARL